MNKEAWVIRAWSQGKRKGSKCSIWCCKRFL